MKKTASLLITFFYLFNYHSLYGQQQEIDLRAFDYSTADSIALNFPKSKHKSYTELVAPLVENLNTDHEKFRVLFRWITDNISYSYSNRTGDVDKVIKKQTAVCAGYANLLKEMCNSAGIECEVISGSSKTSVEDINKKIIDSGPGHAWNAVKLYDNWYLVDVTWASGYYIKRKRKFVKEFNDFYYLTPPEIFIKNHLPKDKKWQLLDKTMKKNEFTKTHLYYHGFFDNRIKNLEPHNGSIKIKLKDTLTIEIEGDLKIESSLITLAQGIKETYYELKIVKKENRYFLKQKFEKPGLYELILFLNNSPVASYRLEIKE
jgi:transglutaminase/protease-like cytokinesis protein 3